MFNVVYNANYLSFIERAISGRDMSNCRITRFKTLKFRSPARLGDKIQVNITQPIGSNKISSKVFSSSAEYSSCNNIEYQKKFIPLNNIINVKDVSEFNIIPGGKKHISEFTVWTDELGREGYLISKTILQLMERARTDILGGPQVLAQIAKGSKHIYVARISDFVIHADICLPSNDVPYHKVNVLTVCQPLGSPSDLSEISMLNFIQSIIDPISQNILASATVTCSCVDAQSGSPTFFSSDIAINF
jgi:acyl-CoA thioesterase FadM